MKIGPIEKKIYELRAKHPLVIPQIDPDNYTDNKLQKVLNGISSLDLSHIAIGGSIVDARHMQRTIKLVSKDFDFTSVSYITNNSLGLLDGIKGKTAIYWMSVMNAENPFFLRDNLIMNSIPMSKKNFELLPTAYVFDDRNSQGSANWLARSVLIPRKKAELSLATALASQYLGMRFYIMAGGSGSSLAPPLNHVALIKKKTDMFLIPTSGIKKTTHARALFSNGADAIHVGNLLESKNGLKILSNMVKISKNYDGKEFL
jgi:phosphoglycerol geranylgeranyltransferase